MRSSVLRSARETTAPDEQEKLAATARKIALDLEDLPRSSDLDAVRGVEGESTRNYFSTFSLMVRGDRQTFSFLGRNHNLPDPMNALLSSVCLVGKRLCGCRPGGGAGTAGRFSPCPATGPASLGPGSYGGVSAHSV